MSNQMLNNIIFSAKFGGGDPVEFARVLMTEHRLPIYYGYTFSCAASSWLRAMTREADTRRYYEAEAWDRLRLYELVAGSSSRPVGVVGLATGEGLGEVELLRKILADGHSVHYLAIDLSPILLMAHIEIVREVFDSELKEGRLLCAGVVGDVFVDLSDSLNTARAEFKRSGVISDPEEFLPSDSVLLVTYLGNCLGNNSADSEKEIFAAVSRSFTPRHSQVAMIVGFSVMRSEPDYYSPTFGAFLLEIPYYLLKDLKILRSDRPGSSAAPEEFMVHANNGRCERLMAVTPRSYSSDGIEGQIYDFDYRLAFDLTMPSLGLDLPAGTAISLYAVSKFKPESLAKSLERDGFTVIYEPDYRQRIETEFGVREYVVVAALLPVGKTLDEDLSDRALSGSLR